MRLQPATGGVERIQSDFDPSNFIEVAWVQRAHGWCGDRRCGCCDHAFEIDNVRVLRVAMRTGRLYKHADHASQYAAVRARLCSSSRSGLSVISFRPTRKRSTLSATAYIPDDAGRWKMFWPRLSPSPDPLPRPSGTYFAWKYDSVVVTSGRPTTQPNCFQRVRIRPGFLRYAVHRSNEFLRMPRYSIKIAAETALVRIVSPGPPIEAGESGACRVPTPRPGQPHQNALIARSPRTLGCWPSCLGCR
jgi:hypothetical protein